MSIGNLRRLINGGLVEQHNITAFCCFRGHPGFLNRKLVKTKRCVEKQCRHFIKQGNSFWGLSVVQAQIINDARSIGAKLQKTKLSMDEIYKRDNIIRKTLTATGHVYVTSIKNLQHDLVQVSFLYDIRINLSLEVLLLQKELRVNIALNPIAGCEENIERFIRKPRRDKGKITDLLSAPKVGYVAKNRLENLGIHCLEDLLGKCPESLFNLDSKISGGNLNRRFLSAYRSASKYAHALNLHKFSP